LALSFSGPAALILFLWQTVFEEGVRHTEFRIMRRIVHPLLILALGLLLAPRSFGVEKSFGTGKLIAVEHKSRDKVDMYLVNTPVTTAVPYFELRLHLGATDYIAEYTPRHSEEELPGDWKPGSEVEARIDKRHLFLKRPDGSEMQWIITKRIAVNEKVAAPVE
jgi:hypothetical protein